MSNRPDDSLDSCGIVWQNIQGFAAMQKLVQLPEMQGVEVCCMAVGVAQAVQRQILEPQMLVAVGPSQPVACAHRPKPFTL